MVQFTLPIKPLRVSQAWQGQRFKTPAYKQYERDISRLLGKQPLTKGNVEVTIEFFVKNDKASDLDNFLKALLDTFTKCGLWEDDSRIYALHLYKEHADTEHMRVTITEFDL